MLNLLASVFEALERGDADAADFADNVGRFLGVFGRARDLAALLEQAERAAGAPGSDAWYLTRSNAGEQLYHQGQFVAAQSVFEEILSHLGEAPSYKRARTLLSLARCHAARGELDSAEVRLRQALRELATLPAGRVNRDLEGTVYSDLGDVLLNRGDLDGAELEHSTGLKISEEIGDPRGVAVGNGQLGSIYVKRRDFSRAAQSFHDAIAAFERLQEPVSVAIGYNNLGYALDQARDFGGAERAFRRSAEIKESMGDRWSAATTWLNLAVTVQNQGRPIVDVEPWYRKALAVFDTENDNVKKALTLSNLADVLQTDPARLSEARELARQALAIEETLDPGASEIWKSYSILARIADKQGDSRAATSYRAQARQSYAAAPIAREELRRHRTLFGAVLLHDPAARLALEEALSQRAARGWGKLVASLRAILDGERDEDALCAPLDREDSLIVHTILGCLGDPEAAKEFLSPDA